MIGKERRRFWFFNNPECPPFFEFLRVVVPLWFSLFFSPDCFDHNGTTTRRTNGIDYNQRHGRQKLHRTDCLDAGGKSTSPLLSPSCVDMDPAIARPAVTNSLDRAWSI